VISGCRSRPPSWPADNWPTSTTPGSCQARRWTIPTGGLKKNETLTQCAIRECREETALDIEVISLVGVFSDPGHVIAYRDGEVRQPVNACFAGRVIGGSLATTDEASEVAWVPPARLDDYNIHPSIRRRIVHGLEGGAVPHVD
jgi:ADP-ribose pyrophosphatase YjhB (NUDIX family)